MIEIEEGDLTFSFPEGCKAGKYDEWAFYRNQFISVAAGSKGVDVVCVSPNAAWLIEIKDYRQHRREKKMGVADEVARKVRDTLAGLAAASANANCPVERSLARDALRARRWRVALHLEQPGTRRRLWRRAFNVHDVQMKLRQKVKAVDAHAVVRDRMARSNNVPWSVL